jgi:hypothetical protein
MVLLLFRHFHAGAGKGAPSCGCTCRRRQPTAALVASGRSCEWQIRAGATGSVQCGEQRLYFACDSCADLFGAKPQKTSWRAKQKSDLEIQVAF